MREYLKNLIEEKGKDLNNEITCLEEIGHFGVTYKMLIDFMVKLPRHLKRQARNTLVYIDFKDGDVFHYLHFLAKGMVTITAEDF